MTRQGRIREAVFRAVDSVNETLAPEARIPKDLENQLFGVDGPADSIVIVNLILETEQALEGEFGVLINLITDAAMDPDTSSFATLATLEAHIGQLLQEAEDGYG